MAKKISELALLASPDGTEYVPGVSAGVTKRFNPGAGSAANRPEIIIPAVLGGVVDNTTMVEDAIAAAPEQAVLRFRDPGLVRVERFVVDKAVKILGASGPFGTVIRPTVDTADAIVDFQVVPSGSGLFNIDYGAGLENVGIDLTYAPTAKGLEVGSTTYWFEGRGLVISGGVRCLEHHGANSHFDRLMLFDCSDCMIYVDDDGLESSFSRINMARNVAALTDAYMKVILASGGQKGDLRLDRLQCGSNTAVGDTNFGMLITAPTLTNLPVFARGVTLDNLTGDAGAGLVLTNIESVDFAGGWINSAGTGVGDSGGPCVKITGGGDMSFRGNKYRGGGASPKTYEFVGGSTRGFTSKDNYCPTGPVYYLPGSGKPTDMRCDDDIVGATDVTQITNDPTSFRAAARRVWGFDWKAAQAKIEQETIRLVGDVGQPAFTNSWVNMAGSLIYFWKDSLGVVHLAGRCQSGTTGLAFTLPAGYRPVIQEEFHTQSGVAAQVYVGSDGTVSINPAAFPAGICTLSGISFFGAL